MAVLTIEQAIADLRAEGNGEDERIQSLLDAAIQSAADYINREIPWQDEGGVAVDVPEPVNAAIRLELRALFADPESIHSKAFKALLNPYRVY